MAQIKKYRCIKAYKDHELGEIVLASEGYPYPEYWELIEEPEEEITITKEENILLKEWFESNFLDGDKIQDGQMLASSESFNAVCGAVSLLKTSKPTISTKKWEDIEKEYYETLYSFVTKSTGDWILNLFKPHFLSLQQRIKELEEDNHYLLNKIDELKSTNQ